PANTSPAFLERFRFSLGRFAIIASILFFRFIRSRPMRIQAAKQVEGIIEQRRSVDEKPRCRKSFRVPKAIASSFRFTATTRQLPAQKALIPQFETARVPPLIEFAATLSNMIGTKLAHYEITAHLGSGGMGDVYQATDSKLGRSVAVKLLPESFAH